MQTAGGVAALEYRFGPDYVDEYLRVRTLQFTGLFRRWNAYWLLEAPAELHPDHSHPGWLSLDDPTSRTAVSRQTSTAALRRARRRWLVEQNQLTDVERDALVRLDLEALRFAGVGFEEARELHDLVTQPTPRKGPNKRRKHR